MTFSQRIDTLVSYKNPVLLTAAFLIISADRTLILLLNTKNLHNLPIPSLTSFNLVFSILTLGILLLFYSFNSSITQKETLFFIITLFFGVDTLLSVLIQNSILAPLVNTIALFISLLLFLFLAFSGTRLKYENFPNVGLIVLLTSLGLFFISMSGLIEIIGIKNINFYIKLVGNLLILTSVFLFSTLAIMVPYLNNQRSIVRTFPLFLGPLITSFVMTIVFLNRELILQIITTILAQTLNLTIFREIPGLLLSVQPFFLILNLSAVLLMIVGLISISQKTTNKETVLWILIISILGLEIATSFVNVIRLIAIYQLNQEISFKIRSEKRKNS